MLPSVLPHQRRLRALPSPLAAGLLALTAGTLRAQDAPSHAHEPATAPAATMPATAEHGDDAPMRGLLGPYAMSREASGTSWQPQATPMGGSAPWMTGEWMWMAHGSANLVVTDNAGPRGDRDTVVQSMGMLMGMRPLGPGTLGVRAMVSLDPWGVGKTGYPLLFQTGETADGRTPLIDRQHPHDLFMELAASYAQPLGESSSAFVYLGLPGEPALGPPTFMHRFSGMDNPEAPLGHHWLDATHITFGVATLGWVWKDLKVEGSAFNAREPDQVRTNIELRALDSWSGRVSYNPSERWALQVSRGVLRSPEQLEPDVDMRRTTASVIYHHPFERAQWQTTLAWGRNQKLPGHATESFLLESALVIDTVHTLFGRVERVDKDELFGEDEPLAGQVFTVDKATFGAIHDFPPTRLGRFGLGLQYSRYAIPAALKPVYGNQPDAWLAFARWRL